MKNPDPQTRVSRRAILGASLSTGAALACASTSVARQTAASEDGTRPAVKDRPTLVGSANALPGMRLHYAKLAEGAEPLDVALEVVKLAEANPSDHSVGLGGLPNENGVVQLDSAVMHGPTHNSGAVASIENILHPCEVARLVMERTDHCLVVGPGAYQFARQHGHEHVELLTDEARKIWRDWKETMSDRDDRLPPRSSGEDDKQGKHYLFDGRRVAHADLVRGVERPTGTIHCSALAKNGDIACTTTTSGLSWKIPGRVGDSPIVGAGLYCDQEAGSAGATGRGEAAILSNGSFAIVERMRQGESPVDAGLEVLGRIARQAQRGAAWQPQLLDDRGLPAFNIKFYILGLDGTTAGVALRGKGKFAVADPEGGPRMENLVSLLG